MNYVYVDEIQMRPENTCQNCGELIVLTNYFGAECWTHKRLEDKCGPYEAFVCYGKNASAKPLREHEHGYCNYVEKMHGGGRFQVLQVIRVCSFCGLREDADAQIEKITAPRGLFPPVRERRK